MAFTQVQKDQIIAALRTKGAWATTGCPVCGNRAFTVADGLAFLIFQDAPTVGFQFGGASLPLVPVMCKNCGFTNLMNAFILGVADQVGLTTPAAKTGD